MIFARTDASICRLLIYQIRHLRTRKGIINNRIYLSLKDEFKMDLISIINVVFLCAINASFMIGGIFLNVVVIISLWRSSQLRKKLCYFTIFILSCFDLAVVVVTHPVFILSTIVWSMDIYLEEIRFTRVRTASFLGGFSMFALLTLNIERFPALTYPFFHQSSVTKKKLTILLVIFVIIEIALLPLFGYFQEKKFDDIIITAFLIFILLIFIYINCKVFVIAKSKHKNKTGASSETSTPRQQEGNKRKINFKNISTCFLAVGCFFICSTPQLIYCIWRLTSDTSLNDRHVILFNIWSNTFVSMNSTFNCVIFFWRNSILRREGMKILKRFRSSKSWLVFLFPKYTRKYISVAKQCIALYNIL